MNPQIRMIGRYGTYRTGEILAPPASLRKVLLDRRLAEMVSNQPRVKSSLKPKRKRK